MATYTDIADIRCDNVEINPNGSNQIRVSLDEVAIGFA